MPGQNEFPRTARLTRQKEYQRSFKEGRRVAGRCFVCFLARREGGSPRLGLAVSRKVGNAVRRNLVKRRVREYFRANRAGIEPGIDLVFVAKPGAAELEWDALVAELEQLLQRGGAFRG